MTNNNSNKATDLAKTLPGEALVVISFFSGLDLTDAVRYPIDQVRITILIAMAIAAILTFYSKKKVSTQLTSLRIADVLKDQEKIIFPLLGAAQAICYCYSLWGAVLIPDYAILGPIMALFGFFISGYTALKLAKNH